MKKFLAAGLLALSAFSAAHSATVVNGNFETGFSLSTGYSLGSTFMNNNASGNNAYGFSSSGDGAYAGNISGNSSIAFALTDLSVGQSYVINFTDALSSFAATAADPLNIYYNGVQIGSVIAASTNWASGSSGVFSATGTSGTLTFTGGTANVLFGTNHTVGLDSVSIASAGGTAAVPEPATWAMMIGGFGMVGGALRRRRASLSLA